MSKETNNPATEGESSGSAGGALALAETAVDIPRRSPKSRARSEGEAARWCDSRLDHYDVKDRIGSGGMGEVYRGHDRSLDREVAIKVLLPQRADDAELQERFMREARAQARLRSAHVAQIHYIGHCPPDSRGHASLYFAMEYVRGGALEDLLERGTRLEPERARQLMIQAATGLGEAHRAGIVHRDIKPGNLLLDESGTLKLADFGIAKSMGELGITAKGAILGSPHYMPPEQGLGEELDHRADIYSLGCTFYHLLAGSPPFDGAAAATVAAKHVAEKARPLGEVAPEVPAALCTIVERMMEKKPAERFDSHDQLIAALEAAAPGAVRYAGFWVRGAAAAIDAAIAGLAVAAIGWPGLVIYLAGLSLMHTIWGRSLGKYLLALKVQSVDGSDPSWNRALARTVLSMWFPFVAALVILLTGGVAPLVDAVERMQPAELDALRGLVTAVVVGNAALSMLYFAGLVLAAVHPQKRSLHDLVAGTVVVYDLPGSRASGSPPSRG